VACIACSTRIINAEAKRWLKFFVATREHAMRMTGWFKRLASDFKENDDIKRPAKAGANQSRLKHGYVNTLIRLRTQHCFNFLPEQLGKYRKSLRYLSPK